MLKLYKRIEKKLYYHEAWCDGNMITEHWGLVGDHGETRCHPLPRGVDQENAVRDVLHSAMQDGYQAIPIEDHAVLSIEYRVEGFGTRKELERRHVLQARLDETLGWTGLGHCDGGSAGSDTMEVCCLVVDFDIAKRVIEENLKNTEFRAFSRIVRGDFA